jgi:hypothetical protein
MRLGPVMGVFAQDGVRSRLGESLPAGARSSTVAQRYFVGVQLVVYSVVTG